jgi:hypothetical protein
VKGFVWRWQRQLPKPFTKNDLRSGSVNDLAFRPFEVSDTVIFDRPQTGRAWFEGVIRDHLDIGRPIELVQLGEGSDRSRRASHHRAALGTLSSDVARAGTLAHGGSFPSKPTPTRRG